MRLDRHGPGRLDGDDGCRPQAPWRCSSRAFVTRRVWQDILDHGLSIDIEMVVRSYKLRLRRCEFPTSERARLAGDSHFKIWPTGKKLLRYLWFELGRPAQSRDVRPQRMP